MLKAKIQQRPPRKELERRHILESDNVDPSLAERQRMLKKARLVDQLNDQLSHRPGPLELIQKNILHTEEPIENAVKAGRIPYKATCEGQLNRPQHPHVYINPEDDSQSSEGDTNTSPAPSEISESSKPAEIVVSIFPSGDNNVLVANATPLLNQSNNEVLSDLCQPSNTTILNHTSAAPSPASIVSSTSILSPLSSVSSPLSSLQSQPSTPAPLPVTFTARNTASPLKTDAPGKDKNRKKSKSKSAPKIRTIKFHEYKGPPSAQKNSSQNNNAAGESSYDLLLQQQTLLLQFQLQLQHKYPQIILPASQKNSNESSGVMSNSQNAAQIVSSDSIAPSKLLGRLEDMKVSDLKAELKRRNLPVSGSKPQLIERLKPFTSTSESGNQQVNGISETSMNTSETNCQSSKNEMDSPVNMNTEEFQESMEVGDPLSPVPCLNQESQQQKTQDDIVREQQRQIEELQRELTLSQLKLQAAQRAEPKNQMLALQKYLQAKQEAAIQMQKIQSKQAQINNEAQKIHYITFQNQKNLPKNVTETEGTTMFNQLNREKAKIMNKHARANSLPNFLNTIVAVTNPSEIKPEYQRETKPPPPPPVYENETEDSKKSKSNVKSQIVDDVLEILIKNGELPPSAAQDPSTPGSASTKNVEPIFPNNNNCTSTNNNKTINCNNNLIQPPHPSSPESALGLDSTDLLDTLETLENMDFSILVREFGCQQANENSSQNNENNPLPMDTDEWLDSLLPSENHNTMSPAPVASQESNHKGFDPLLGFAQDPFDAFLLEDFRSSSDLTTALWDKVDFAA